MDKVGLRWDLMVVGLRRKRERADPRFKNSKNRREHPRTVGKMSGKQGQGNF